MSTSPWLTVTGWAAGICWGLFAVVWLAGAIYNAVRGPATQRRSGANLPYVLASVAIVWVALRLLPPSAWHWSTVEASWVRALGLVILIAATAFTLWARGVLGVMWSSVAVLKDEHALRTTGPYGITRHPIYTGLLGMLLGTALLSGLGPWAALFVLAALLFQWKIYTEERLLAQIFPGDYEKYRKQVPQLIPGLGAFKRRST